MDVWYNKIDRGEVISKKQLKQDFWFSYISFILLMILLTFFCLMSTISLNFLGIALLIGVLIIVYDNQIHVIKKYYRENYFRSDKK